MPTASQLIKNNLLTTDTCRCASNALGQKKTRQAIVQSCLAAFWIVAGCVGVGQQKIYRHTSNLQHATLASVGRRFLGAHKWRKAKKKIQPTANMCTCLNKYNLQLYGKQIKLKSACDFHLWPAS